MKFQNEGNRCFQIFELSANKPVLKIASDKRYDLYDKLNSKINEVMLSNLSDIFTFTSRIEEDKNIIIEYSINGKINKEILVNYFFVIASFLPGCSGCEYCIYCNKKDGIINCELKKQTIAKALHRCVVFKQRSLFKT